MNAVHIHMYLKQLLARQLGSYKTPLLDGYLFTLAITDKILVPNGVCYNIFHCL